MSEKRPLMLNLILLVAALGVIGIVSAFSLSAGLAAAATMGVINVIFTTATETAALDFGASKDGHLPLLKNVMIMVGIVLVVTLVAAENLPEEPRAALYGGFGGGVGGILLVVLRRYRKMQGQDAED